MCHAGALSRGDAALFLRFPAATYREKIWDHAAGAVIVTEAGGSISDAGGAPLDFSKGRWGHMHAILKVCAANTCTRWQPESVGRRRHHKWRQCAHPLQQGQGERCVALPAFVC